MSNVKIKWNNADFKWDNNEHLWNLVEEVLDEITSPSGGGSKRRREEEKKKWEKKKKKVIKLVMWRKGIKIYDEKKEVKNIKNHIKDIKLIAEELKSKIKIII